MTNIHEIEAPLLVIEPKLSLSYVETLNTKVTPQTIPYYLDLFTKIVDSSLTGDSQLKPECNKLLDNILTNINPNSISIILSFIFEGISPSNNWKLRVKYLQMLEKLADTFPEQICVYLPDIIPELTPHMNEIKKEVKTAAYNSMIACCNVVGNSDIEHMTQHIVTAIREPIKVPEVMHELAGVVFVQSVKSSALAMVVPLLLRGLTAKLTSTRRQSAVIIENMSKLVDEPVEATPFLPRLLPSLKMAEDAMSDPEARSVIERAIGQLEKLEKNSKGMSYKLDLNQITDVISNEFKANNLKLNKCLSNYIANMCICLTLQHNFEETSWNEMNLLFKEITNQDLIHCINNIKQYCSNNSKQLDNNDEEDTDETLCDCAFTLAYGTKILLHNTKMKLKRGRKYGLIGPTNAGKSTFLKSMANGSLEGFPDPSEVKTVFVQADVLGELSHLSCIDYVMSDPMLQSMDRELVLKALDALGFNDKSPAKPSSPVHTFSGGYRIKMALATAMLKNPDILLLDEPVKHLDVLNIAWVKNYICSLNNVTCIMVSKNRGFLNECCTDIVNIDSLKLYQHRGNLDSFLSENPEYIKYYEIKESEMKFTFPPVTMVDGVKSKEIGRAHV